MEKEKLFFRAGFVALAVAVVIRLAGSGFFGAVWDAMKTPRFMQAIFLLETGQLLRPKAAEETQPPPETQPEAMAQPVFSEADADLVAVKNYSGREVSVATLLQQPLDWSLQKQEPTVLILHSHGTESYTKTEDYKETTRYRTENVAYNVVSVGARLTRLLQAGGVGVIHDKVMHDAPSYSKSYSHARASTKEILAENPSISLVLDLHRDGVENKKGEQVGFRVETEKGTAAQLMLVVGTDSNLSHENWPENMALAVKIHALLEKKYPGICRPISFRAQRFNQDLSTGALIVEVGAAGNTRQEALLAAEILAEVILELSAGSATADSTR